MKIEFSLYELSHNLIKEMLKYTKSQLILRCPPFNKIYDNKDELSKIIYNLLRSFTDRLHGGRIILNITKLKDNHKYYYIEFDIKCENGKLEADNRKNYNNMSNIILLDENNSKLNIIDGRHYNFKYLLHKLVDI